MVMVVVVMMVLGRGKRRRGNHHNEQGGEQKFLHACILASARLRQHTILGEQVKNRYQERNGEEQGTRIEVKQRLSLSVVAS
jgi:hypothetical protein